MLNIVGERERANRSSDVVVRPSGTQSIEFRLKRLYRCVVRACNVIDTESLKRVDLIHAISSVMLLTKTDK